MSEESKKNEDASVRIMIRNGHQKNGGQEYKCNRCEARFNRRKGTPLEGLRTPSLTLGKGKGKQKSSDILYSSLTQERLLNLIILK